LRIVNYRVKNYRSLKNINLKDIGNLIILIGKNGSGKSNILESLELFFTDLNLIEMEPRQYPPTTWHDKMNWNPIDFQVTIEFTEEESIEIIGKDFYDTLQTKGWIGNNILFIHRVLNRDGWTNEKIEYSKVISISRGIVEPKPAKDGTAYVIKKEVLDSILVKFNKKLKNSFELVKSIRESAERPSEKARPTILDPESRDLLTKLGVSQDRNEEMEWEEFMNRFESISGKHLQVRTALEVKIGDLALPIEFSGSGDQELMIIMRHFLNKKPFFGIEEPETRLHNAYTRRLHSYFREMSKESQIFIATHSPIFIDKSYLSDTLYVFLKGKETIVKRVDDEDLKEILLDLGIQPSDILLANKILLVEGVTEEFLFPRIAEKCGIDLTSISIIPTHGKSKGKYNLEIWTKVASDTNLPVYMLLDKDAKEELNKLIKKKLIESERCHLLNKKELSECPECDIEDYYNKDILKEVIMEISGENNPDNSKSELKFDQAKPVGKTIDEYLKRKDWKIKASRKVIEKMSSEQIMEDMEEIINFLKNITDESF